MALSPYKTWSAGEVLTASDLNASFNNILNNPVSLISPITAALDMDGYSITLDSAAATSITSTAAVAFSVTTGAKSGTPGTTGSIANWAAHTFTDTNTSGSGTATSFAGFSIQRPTLAATNSSVTTTDAATFYIPNAPAAGTNETITNPYAFWVDDGKVRLDLSSSIVSAAGAVNNALNITAQTATISGSTNITTATGVNLVAIGQPTLSAGTSLTVTNAATLYIAAAPTGAGAGPAAITNAYAVWVDAGNVRFDGSDIITGTTLNFAQAATTLNIGAATGTTTVAGSTMPINSQSTAYTTVAADAGKMILHPAADTNVRTFTIDSNNNVPYPLGTVIAFHNETANVVTIAITSDTMTLAGTTSTGSRSLAQNGVATAIKKTSTTWVISGPGLS